MTPNLLLNLRNCIDVLPKSLLGWLGIFIVTAVIVVSIYLLNYITGKFGNNKKDK